MRIDFVITELFVGGAEKCLTEIALTMHQRGDRVRVFSLASLPTGEQRGLVERLQAAGITVQSAQCNSLWQAVSAYKFLKKQFTDDTPDVVQTFLHHANVIGAYASTSANVTKCVAAIRVAQENRWRNQLEKISLKQVDHTLCVSRAVSQFAHRILGCNPSNTSVIPNGVNLDQFAQHRPASWEAFDWPSDSRVALFIGRLDHQKGLELLQEQIDRIAPSGTNQKLLLIGEGPLRKQIDQWVQEVGTDRVQCLPWQVDVVPWIQASELLILPSRYEGMANVMLEAMAAGKPVVCSLVEGSEELLRDTATLQGFQPGRSVEMADRVQNLMEQHELRQRLGSENQDLIASRYSMPMIMDRYRNFYQALLANNSGQNTTKL